MVKLTLYITVIITTCLSVNKVYSVSLNIDIQKFLQSLQQQLRLEQQKSRPKEPQYNSVEDDGNRNRNHYGSLKKHEIERIVSYLSNNEKYNKNTYRPKKNVDSVQNDDDYFRLTKPAKKVPQKINNLLGLIDRHEHDEKEVHGASTSSSEEVDNPNEYSRVYVLLDSEAVKNSQNKDKLNALLSSLMSGQSGRPYHLNRDDRNQDLSYKGLNWNKSILRRRDDSDEGYAKGGVESIIKEKEYLRPLRQREHGGGRGGHGRGGGSSAGMRTAIPYIGQRGDVYERDN